MRACCWSKIANSNNISPCDHRIRCRIRQSHEPSSYSRSKAKQVATSTRRQGAKSQQRLVHADFTSASLATVAKAGPAAPRLASSRASIIDFPNTLRLPLPLDAADRHRDFPTSSLRRAVLANPSLKMLSSGLRRFTATSRHVQARNFSRTARQNQIITTAPLRAKEVSPMIGNKYPIIDHEYDAVVVGAGGSGQSSCTRLWCGIELTG